MAELRRHHIGLPELPGKAEKSSWGTRRFGAGRIDELEMSHDFQSSNRNHTQPIGLLGPERPARHKADTQTGFYPGFDRFSRVEFHNDTQDPWIYSNLAQSIFDDAAGSGTPLSKQKRLTGQLFGSDLTMPLAVGENMRLGSNHHDFIRDKCFDFHVARARRALDEAEINSAGEHFAHDIGCVCTDDREID